MTSTPAEPPLVNLPNVLTSLRLLLVPVFGVFLIFSSGTGVWWRIAACAAFCIASFTDFFDGRIARAWNLVTTFGKVADPIADKALVGTALVLMSWFGMLWWWVTALILIREIGVTVLRFWVIRHGVIPASRGGKVKTILQVTAIAWLVWPWPFPLHLLGPWMMAAAVVVTVVTGVDYVFQALRVRKDGLAREKRALADQP
ncbi:CDP-diacylglycerol--glycerol-3-phosphate 3-phosphatidyltransferase [Fodinicola acaciae]|uniref:CDP-diacylglycerol--glycerol-3-phosphate 3-phosphatidyltransferase n=1 Tax=Fodinicola acaciae TaxID=2681555 RepID=UPI0013D153BA|nr:CDP-diacylglycerol--glycerol-3-phosphate 3-phosphatidyltransferase [Fodinicola acaciae]